jgi:hypothetical protein
MNRSAKLSASEPFGERGGPMESRTGEWNTTRGTGFIGEI